MKKNLETIENVRSKLEGLIGKEIKFQVNRGRKKYVSFLGQVVATYPSIFTIRATDEFEREKTYSYTEVLCGNVRICTKSVVN